MARPLHRRRSHAMVQMQSWPGWQLISTAIRSLFFAEKRRVIRVVDTAGSRLRANVSCWRGDSSHISDESQTHQQGPSLLRTLCHDSLERHCISWALRSARFCGTHFQCILINRGNEQSNRTPTSAENLRLASLPCRCSLRNFLQRKLLPSAKRRKGLLDSMGIDAATVRHPANGGAKAFARGLELLVGGAPRANCG